MEQNEEKKLTLKQSKWLKEYLELGNATEAAMRVYDCKDRESAAQIGYENLRKLDYEDFLEEAGITDHLLQQKIIEGLDASKQLASRIFVKNPKKATTQKGELIEATETTDDFIEVPDFAIRHKYLETALKLKKRLMDRVDVTSGGKPIPILGGLTNVLQTDNSNKETPKT